MPPDEDVDKPPTSDRRVAHGMRRRHARCKVRGHELRVIGVHDDLTPIRQTIDEFKPTIIFNLMEAFADIGVFDQNVVSYLELLKVPYTGCNPRGLTLSRDKALAQEADGLSPHSGAGLHWSCRSAASRSCRSGCSYPLIVKSLTYESSTGISQASVVANDEQLVKRVQFIHDTILTPAIVEQFIDGRELYVGVIGNDRLQTFPGVGDVVLEDAREQLADRDRAGEVERQVPEEARHRHRARRSCPTAWRRARCSTSPSASIARSISPATRASTSAWTPTARPS